MAFVDEHQDRRTDGLRWGVEPICRVLQFAPSTYYDAKTRPASRRSVTDAELKVEIVRVFRANLDCYGADKIWRQLHREGVACGRDRVARLMRELGIAGVVRGKKKRTTVPADQAQRPGDLVNRDFSAPAPNRLVGRRHHLRVDVVGIRLRGLRDRRVRPRDRGLAGVDDAAG